MRLLQIILSGFIAVLPGLVLATADGPDYWMVAKVDSNDVLNVRSKPNWKSKLLGKIPHNGICLQNLGCQGGLTLQEFTDLPKAEQERIRRKRPRWCLIQYKDLKGWVRGKYLRGYDGECKSPAS